MKIAAFDSGVGGLSAIAPLFKTYPGLEAVYLGDLANLPYGTKSPKRVRELATGNAKWLLEQSGAGPFEHFIVACNTASAHALEAIREGAKTTNVPVTGVLAPGCRHAVESKPKRILVLATSATVASQAYTTEIKRLGFAGEVTQKACPLFVPIVEEGICTGPLAELTVKNYLEPLAPKKGDAVVLGCTHYPFLAATLRKLYPEATWIEAGAALVSQKVLGTPGAGAKRGKLRVLFTDTPPEATLRRWLVDLGLQDIETTFETIAPII